MSVHLGKVLDPHVKLYLQLCGENEESTKIVLRPSGTAVDSFQEGKTYKFSVEMPDIGKVNLNYALIPDFWSLISIKEQNIMTTACSFFSSNPHAID